MPLFHHCQRGLLHPSMRQDTPNTSELLCELQPHLPPPGLTVVKVVQMVNSQDQVGEVQVFVQDLE